MRAHCTSAQLSFQPLGRRRVAAAFDAGPVSSDGGLALLREVDEKTGLTDAFAACFLDKRDPARVQHSVLQLVRQRVFGLALGHEDVSDHDLLRHDPLFCALVGADIDGAGAAGKSTLSRFEQSFDAAGQPTRYAKIGVVPTLVEEFFVDRFVASWGSNVPERLVLDVDASDILLHGGQQGRFYHGYYGGYCYLPLYIVCGQHVLMAKLRRANRDGAIGTADALDWIVASLRQAWPDVEICVRGDSGFARDGLLAWCEDNDVDYIIGVARNDRLAEQVADKLEEARLAMLSSGNAERRFADFEWRTRTSWSCARRVVAKAEALPGRQGRKGKANPRYIVTSYDADRYDARTLYEDEYCARGEMENRIKEQQLDMFGDRASCSNMRSNQLRVWLSAVAYQLIVELRRYLDGTELENAQGETIRSKLLKIGARVRISTRRVWISFSSAFPMQRVFALVLARIRGDRPREAPT